MWLKRIHQDYITVVAQGGSLSGQNEDQSRKKELRLLKNREAARECRRKKKEYIKCLENRVAVLENQNKTLMDELKALKDLYCSQKIEWTSSLVRLVLDFAKVFTDKLVRELCFKFTKNLVQSHPHVRMVPKGWRIEKIVTEGVIALRATPLSFQH